MPGEVKLCYLQGEPPTSLGIKIASTKAGKTVFTSRSSLCFGGWSYERTGRRKEQQNALFLLAQEDRTASSSIQKESKSHFHLDHIRKWEKAFQNLFEIDFKNDT